MDTTSHFQSPGERSNRIRNPTVIHAILCLGDRENKLQALSEIYHRDEDLACAFIALVPDSLFCVIGAGSDRYESRRQFILLVAVVGERLFPTFESLRLWSMIPGVNWFWSVRRLLWDAES